MRTLRPHPRSSVSPALLLALVLLALASLHTLAYASPADPSWIPGIYDEGDFDDVVTLIASVPADLSPATPADLELLPLLIESLMPRIERAYLAHPGAAARPRAPPSS
jgi:hypothetical protein